MNFEMKKIMTIGLAVMLVLCMSVSAFAEPGGFVSSPSGNAAPTVLGFTPNNEDCSADLKITPYSERDTLPAELKALLEKAYGDILNSEDLTKLCAALEKLAAEKGISGSDLAVSDLFMAYVTGCDKHDGHTGFDITLGADTLDKFVALLQLNANGEWELIQNASVSENGEELSFTAERLSTPFAIVVNTADSSTGADDGSTPNTGDPDYGYLYIALMAGSALAITALVVKSKKRRA